MNNRQSGALAAQGQGSVFGVAFYRKRGLILHGSRRLEKHADIAVVAGHQRKCRCRSD